MFQRKESRLDDRLSKHADLSGGIEETERGSKRGEKIFSPALRRREGKVKGEGENARRQCAAYQRASVTTMMENEDIGRGPYPKPASGCASVTSQRRARARDPRHALTATTAYGNLPAFSGRINRRGRSRMIEQKSKSPPEIRTRISMMMDHRFMRIWRKVDAPNCPSSRDASNGIR